VDDSNNSDQGSTSDSLGSTLSRLFRETYGPGVRAIAEGRAGRGRITATDIIASGTRPLPIRLGDEVWRNAFERPSPTITVTASNFDALRGISVQGVVLDDHDDLIRYNKLPQQQQRKDNNMSVAEALKVKQHIDYFQLTNSWDNLYDDKKITAKKHGELLDTAQYFRDVALAVQLGWDKIDMTPFIIESKGGHIINTDRVALNKLIFAAANGKQEDIDSKVILKEAIKINFSRVVQGLQEDKNRQLAYAYEKYSGYMEYLSKALRKQLTIDKIRGKDLDIGQQIKDIVSSGNYEFVRYAPGSNTIIFVTKPVYNSYVVPEHQINHNNLPLGRYAVFLRIDCAELKVYPYEDNLSVGSYFHPHVSDTGYVCWGNVSDRATETHANYQLVELMYLLNEVLNNYNHDNPYAQLYRFQKPDENAVQPSFYRHYCGNCEDEYIYVEYETYDWDCGNCDANNDTVGEYAPTYTSGRETYIITNPQSYWPIPLVVSEETIKKKGQDK